MNSTNKLRKILSIFEKKSVQLIFLKLFLKKELTKQDMDVFLCLLMGQQ
jgi:hypothetical protein